MLLAIGRVRFNMCSTSRDVEVQPGNIVFTKLVAWRCNNRLLTESRGCRLVRTMGAEDSGWLL